MRTKELKIENEKREAVLVAGGDGFKIYHATGVSGWIIVIGRTQVIISEDDVRCSVVSDYVNLKYHPANQQLGIKEMFMELVQQCGAK